MKGVQSLSKKQKERKEYNQFKFVVERQILLLSRQEGSK